MLREHVMGSISRHIRWSKFDRPQSVMTIDRCLFRGRKDAREEAVLQIGQCLQADEWSLRPEIAADLYKFVCQT